MNVNTYKDAVYIRKCIDACNKNNNIKHAFDFGSLDAMQGTVFSAKAREILANAESKRCEILSMASAELETLFEDLV